MARKLCVLVALFGLSAGPAFAQEVDARAALLASLKAMGGENLKTIEIAAAGSSSLIGQQYSIEGNWPQFEVANYTRAIDFDAKWSREDYTRRQGNFPTFGRVPMAEQRITAIVSGQYAWDMRDTTPVPVTRPYLDGVPVNELRQLELAITPHGFLKAALASKDAKAIKIQYIGASDFGLSQFGRWVTMVQFTFLGKYSIVGTIDDKNLVELVGTWFPNPVYGDMDYEMRYTEYKDFGGVKFPMLLHTHQGDPRLNVAHNYYEYRVTSVKPNAPVATIPVPDVVKSAVTPPAKVESQQLAPGVWLLGGGTHNSLLVEFKEYVAVVDAPNNEERSLAVIAEAARLAPKKPVQYVINTHHHFDHAGGLREAVAEGAAILTYRDNKRYYDQVLSSRHTVNPDRLERTAASRKPSIEVVVDKRVLTDGTQMVELYKIQGSNHADTMLIAYLPKDKLLVEADMWNPPAQPNAPTPIGVASAEPLNLWNNIQRLKLDVAQIAPLHGRLVPFADFQRSVGSGPTTH